MWCKQQNSEDAPRYPMDHVGLTGFDCLLSAIFLWETILLINLKINYEWFVVTKHECYSTQKWLGVYVCISLCIRNTYYQESESWWNKSSWAGVRLLSNNTK